MSETLQAEPSISDTGGHTVDRGHLTPRQFARLAEFIESYSGIKMPPSKLTMIEGRLRKRVRATGLASLSDYCTFLFEQGGLESETIALIDVVTTNKTEFFREPEHFRALADQVVPQLLAGDRATPLKIWSAACSIGAEPYTIAMVIADLAQRLPGLRAAITATDICTEVLQTAVTGIYPEAMLQAVPPDIRRRYVLRAKDKARLVGRIVPELRAMVQFGRVNLMEPPFPVAQDMDAIFCRNILIYFDRPTQEAVLRRLTGHLRRNGFLFLGHSETLAGHLPMLKPAGPNMFRKL